MDSSLKNGAKKANGGKVRGLGAETFIYYGVLIYNEGDSMQCGCGSREFVEENYRGAIIYRCVACANYWSGVSE